MVALKFHEMLTFPFTKEKKNFYGKEVNTRIKIS